MKPGYLPLAEQRLPIALHTDVARDSSVGLTTVHTAVTPLFALNRMRSSLSIVSINELTPVVESFTEWGDRIKLLYKSFWRACADGSYDLVTRVLSQIISRTETKIDDIDGGVWAAVDTRVRSIITRPDDDGISPLMIAAMRMRGLRREQDLSQWQSYVAILDHLHALDAIQIPVYLKSAYFKQSLRFPRIATMVMSGRLMLVGGYFFQVTVFIQAKNPIDLAGLEQPLLSKIHSMPIAIEGGSLKLSCMGIIYLPNDQPFSLAISSKVSMPHLKHTSYCEGLLLGHVNQALAETLLPSVLDSYIERYIYLPLVQMVHSYMDNMRALPELNIDGMDADTNYKLKRMALWRSSDADAMMTELKQAYGEFEVGTLCLFFDTHAYRPALGNKLNWFGPTLVSLVELAYVFVGSYLMFAWNPLTMMGVGLCIAVALIRRLFKLIAMQRERDAKHLYRSMAGEEKQVNKDMLYLADILQARLGLPWKVLVKNYHCSLKSFFNMFMHYFHYSKWKQLAHIPEDILIWAAYFNGLTLVAGKSPVLFVGCFLGLVNFALRHLLHSVPISHKYKHYDKAMLWVIAFFYGACYLIKDLIALHYLLLFVPDFLNSLNNTYDNATLNLLRHGIDPWITPYNETLDMPLLDNLSLSLQIFLLVIIALLDLAYYVFGLARSPHHANPPGSRRFGNTFCIDKCGKFSMIHNTAFDIGIVFTLQTGEMLFGIQMVVQIMNALLLLPEEILLACTFLVAPILAIIAGAVMMFVNVGLSAFLCCPKVQPWLTKPDHARYKQKDLTADLNQVYFDLMDYQAANNVIDEGEAFVTWLAEQVSPEALNVKVYLQATAISTNWQMLRIHMQRSLPPVGITTDQEWARCHHALLKMAPPKHVATTSWHDKRATISQGAMLWRQRTGNGAVKVATTHQDSKGHIIEL